MLDLLKRLIPGSFSAGGTYAEPPSDADILACLTSRQAETGSSTEGGDWQAAAESVLTAFVSQVNERARLDPASRGHIPAIVTASYAAGIPLRVALQRRQIELNLHDLVFAPSRRLLGPHHDAETRKENALRINAIFAKPTAAPKPLQEAIHKMGQLAIGWYTTGDPTYVDAFAQCAKDAARHL